jgi:hypothetical protein
MTLLIVVLALGSATLVAMAAVTAWRRFQA